MTESEFKALTDVLRHAIKTGEMVEIDITAPKRVASAYTRVLGYEHSCSGDGLHIQVHPYEWETATEQEGNSSVERLAVDR